MNSCRSVQFGKSKLFFRVGVLAKIEDERRLFVQKNATKLQAVVRGHASRARASYRKAFIRILAACRVVQAQRLYRRTIGAIMLQAATTRALCCRRHGGTIVAGHSLATSAAACVKRRAFITSCVRSRAGVCASSAGKRAVARSVFCMSSTAAVTSQALMKQCLLRSLYARTCAADTLKRFCITKRLVRAKQSMLLMNAAAFKILLARRRSQFYRRWYIDRKSVV